MTARTTIFEAENATFYRPHEMFGHWSAVPCRSIKVEQGQYAQYSAAFFVTYTPKGKRKARCRVFYGNSNRFVVTYGQSGGPDCESMFSPAQVCENGVTFQQSRRAAFDGGWDAEMARRFQGVPVAFSTLSGVVAE